MDLESAKVVTDGRQWEKNLPELGDLEVLVAPWDNPAFNRELQKRINALPPGLRVDGRVDPTAMHACLGYAMAKAILFDWKNAKLGGQDQPFNKDFVEKLLVDQKYKPLSDGIIAAAKRVQQGVKKLDEDIEGNFGASSAGNGSGEAIPTV